MKITKAQFLVLSDLYRLRCTNGCQAGGYNKVTERFLFEKGLAIRQKGIIDITDLGIEVLKEELTHKRT